MEVRAFPTVCSEVTQPRSQKWIWGTAALIEAASGGDAYHPQIALAANGNALAVWEQSDGTHTNIWANRFQ